MDIDQQIAELNEEIRCHLKPSSIHGIGVFALRDIKKGEKEVRPLWGLGIVKRKVPIYETHYQKSSNHRSL